MSWLPWGSGKVEAPRLSVCVITLDRADQLRGLLQNVTPWAWETVVLDGGSSDDTDAVCAEFPGVRLEHHPWDGHFGLQKNRCFDRARGDWILDIDTDERVGPWLEDKLPELCASRRHVFYRLPMYWLTSLDPPTYVDSKKHYPCHIPRLFRNLPEHRYLEEKPIHPRYADEVVARMKKVNGAHLFHYTLVWQGRAELERKMAAYEETMEGADETSRKYYAWWEVPHTLRPCKEPPPRHGSGTP